jgi:hypothetical protein
MLSPETDARIPGGRTVVLRPSCSELSEQVAEGGGVALEGGSAWRVRVREVSEA